MTATQQQITLNFSDLKEARNLCTGIRSFANGQKADIVEFIQLVEKVLAYGGIEKFKANYQILQDLKD